MKGRAKWVDIWADDDAAAYVRMVNDGNETVPTVVIDGVPPHQPQPVRGTSGAQLSGRGR